MDFGSDEFYVARDDFAKKVFRKGTFVMNANGICDWDGVNLSDMCTFLIQQAGRFVEHQASDLFIEWKSVEKLVLDDGAEPGDTVFLFGLREDGVDSSTQVFDRLKFRIWGNTVYRKLYALYVNCGWCGEVYLELRDCSHVSMSEI